MAEETAVAAVPPQDSKRETIAFFIGVAGWLVPGLGHALLKMWGRAVLSLVNVSLLGFLRAGIRGNVVILNGKDFFDNLCIFSDLGIWNFYIGASALVTYTECG